MPAPIPEPRPEEDQPGRGGPGWAWVGGSADGGTVPGCGRQGPQPEPPTADGLPAGLDYAALLDGLAASGALGGEGGDQDAELAEYLAAEEEGRLGRADHAAVAAAAVEFMGPGAAQAGWLEVAAAGLGRLDENALTGVAIAARQAASRAQATELAAVAQITARAAAADPGIGLSADGRPARVCRDALGQVEFALRLGHYSAEAWADLAVTLTWRLPATGQALAAGRIDLDRAGLIAAMTGVLTQEQARWVEAKILPAAGRLTRAELRERLARAVIAADPDGAERRREQAERNADVRLYADEDQTATITGSKLPQVLAAAGFARLTALARARKAAGLAGSLGFHRAQVMLGMLLDTLPWIPPADGAPPDQPPPDPDPGPGPDGPDPDPGPDGGPGPERGPGDGDPGDPARPGDGQDGPRDDDALDQGPRDQDEDPADEDPADEDAQNGDARHEHPENDSTHDDSAHDDARNQGTPEDTGHGERSRDEGSTGADSRGADSRGADSRGADSRGADSRGADSRGADSRGAGPCGEGAWDDLPAPRDEDAPPDDGFDETGDGGGDGQGWDPAEDDDDVFAAGPVPPWPALGVIPPGLARRPAGPPDGRPVPGLLDAVVPWTTLAGLSQAAGTLGRIGPVTAGQARQLARAAEHDPGAQWRVIVTNTAGQAIAVARIRRPRSRPRAARDGPGAVRDGPAACRDGPPTAGAGLVGRITVTITQDTLTAARQQAGRPRGPRMATPGSRGSPGVPAHAGQQTAEGRGRRGPTSVADAALRAGARALDRALARAAADAAAGGCAHSDQSPAYRPAPRLREYVTARDVTCRSPVCRQPAWRADLDHTRPHHQHGRTCRCNLGGGCRRDHQLKQHRRWKLEQNRPGWFRWTAPSGRTYTVGPDIYPV